MSLYIKNLLHNPILKFQFNTTGSVADSPVGKHQREWVSQVNHNQNPAKFSNTIQNSHLMIDSTPRVNYQSATGLPSEATPRIDNDIYSFFKTYSREVYVS